LRLYLIRHADPDYPNNTITETGHREARALAGRLANENLDRIYVSPLGRARDTMQYTIDRTGLPFQVEDWNARPPLDDPAFGEIYSAMRANSD